DRSAPAPDGPLSTRRLGRAQPALPGPVGRPLRPHLRLVERRAARLDARPRSRRPGRPLRARAGAGPAARPGEPGRACPDREPARAAAQLHVPDRRAVPDAVGPRSLALHARTAAAACSRDAGRLACRLLRDLHAPVRDRAAGRPRAALGTGPATSPAGLAVLERTCGAGDCRDHTGGPGRDLAQLGGSLADARRARVAEPARAPRRGAVVAPDRDPAISRLVRIAVGVARGPGPATHVRSGAGADAP